MKYYRMFPSEMNSYPAHLTLFTNPNEFKVILFLHSVYDKKTERAIISRRKIAKGTNLSVRQIDRAMKTLAAKDLIRVEHRCHPSGCQAPNAYALAFVNYPPADVLYYDAFLAPEMDEEEEWFDH